MIPVGDHYANEATGVPCLSYCMHPKAGTSVGPFFTMRLDIGAFDVFQMFDDRNTSRKLTYIANTLISRNWAGAFKFADCISLDRSYTIHQRSSLSVQWTPNDTVTKDIVLMAKLQQGSTNTQGWCRRAGSRSCLLSSLMETYLGQLMRGPCLRSLAMGQNCRRHLHYPRVRFISKGIIEAAKAVVQCNEWPRNSMCHPIAHQLSHSSMVNI